MWRKLKKVTPTETTPTPMQQVSCKHATRKDYRHNPQLHKNQGQQHSKNESIRPTKSSKYCPDCGKRKIFFQTEKEALRFMQYNSDFIERVSGYAPRRAYFCKVCSGWHLTHLERPEVDCSMVNQEEYMNMQNQHLLRQSLWLKGCEMRLDCIETVNVMHKTKLLKAIEDCRKILNKLEVCAIVSDTLVSTKQHLFDRAQGLLTRLAMHRALLYLQGSLRSCRRCFAKHDMAGAGIAWQKAFKSMECLAVSDLNLHREQVLLMLDELESLSTKIKHSLAT